MDFVKGVPKLNPNLSYNSLNLTPVEGYLLSRIDGVSSVDDIVSTSGLPYEQAMEVVRSLWNKNVFSIDGVSKLPEEKGDIDLTKEERNNIEKMLEIVENGTFYEVLSVPFNVKPEEVKIRFFELSKLYHPDRYFKKNIGEYKDKLNKIFKKISEAYEVLYDPRKKRWYDNMLASSVSKSAMVKQSSQVEATQSIKPNPLATEKTVKIEKPYHKKHGIQADTTPATARNSSEFIQTTIDQRLEVIKELLNNDMLESALKEIDRIKDTKDARIPLLVADYYVRHDNLLKAKDYAQMAIDLEPDNINAYKMLGNIYMKFKLYRNALKVYESIKRIQPDDTDVDVMINKIKSLIED